MTLKIQLVTRALLIGVAMSALAASAWAAKAGATTEEGTTITASGEEVRPAINPSKVKLQLETNEPLKPLPPGSGMLKKALAGPMKGVEEVVFALRADCAGVENGFIHHWHLNFGYVMAAPEKLLSGVGGRLCKLDLQTGKMVKLVEDAEGTVRDPNVHYDGKKILFSYRKGGQRYCHLYEIAVDGTGLRQLTKGPFDDIEPCYLPDGEIVFVSTRANRTVPCYDNLVATLFRCNADGGNIRRISAGVEQESSPWVLPDGRIVYTRWDYVNKFRMTGINLWTANPDGAGHALLFGNERLGCRHDNVMCDPKPIPGTQKIVFSFGASYISTDHSGAVSVFDPKSGADQWENVRIVAPRPKGVNAHRDPYPFSEDCFLVAFGDRLVLMDGTGTMEEIYKIPAELNGTSKKLLNLSEPRPIIARSREPVPASHVDLSQKTGWLVLSDVMHGRRLGGVQPGEIKKLLVLEELPLPANPKGYNCKSFPISAESASTYVLQRNLGTVPVEADGSAYFEVPAMRSLFFVALDENNRSAKRMQNFVTVMPGETVSCAGCHERTADVSRRSTSMIALSKPPAQIAPIAGVPEIFDFPRDIQPILDRNCVSCHNNRGPDRPAAGLSFANDRSAWYSVSYWTIVSRLVTLPGEHGLGNMAPRSIGSSASKLLDYVDGSHYGAKLTQQERITLSTWIDCSANWPGTYAAIAYQGTSGSGMVIPSAKKAGKDGNLAIPRWLLDVAAGKRCAECHATGRNGGFPAGYYADLVHKQMNLTEPTRSPLLLAPLAKAAGGWGTCTAKNAKPGTGIFADAGDPDYQRLLAGIREEKAKLDEITRFDMPNFKVNPFYVREMKKYGILPLETDPQKTLLDPYAIDAAYFRSFWHVPGQKLSWENNRDVVEVIAAETARGVVLNQKNEPRKTTSSGAGRAPAGTGNNGDRDIQRASQPENEP